MGNKLLDNHNTIKIDPGQSLIQFSIKNTHLSFFNFNIFKFEKTRFCPRRNF